MIKRGAFLGAIGLATTGCAQIAPHTSGESGPDNPTIVSLNPCTDAILAEIAAPEQVLALSHYSHDPRASSMELSKAKAFAVTGGSAEEVLALNPDVVLAGSFLAPATRAAFEDLGIRVETFGIARAVEDSLAQTRRLAKIVGREDAGEQLAQQIAAAASTGDTSRDTRGDTRGWGASKTAADNPSAVLWQPGQIVAGEQQLISDLLKRAGFSSHAAARGLGQADYVSLEMMLADPPDVLLVAGNSPAQRHDALEAMPETQIAPLPVNLLYCGGPTIIRAMEHLRQIRGVWAQDGQQPT